MSETRASRAERVYLGLVADYQSAILNYIYRLVGDRETAEDLTQETYIKAYRALDRLELREESEPRRRAWLYRIAHNTATDYLRRKSRFTWVPLDAVRQRGTPDPEEKLVETEPIKKALSQIGEQQREVLYLFSHAGLDSAEVADVLGVSVAAARKRRQRARAAFEKIYRGIVEPSDKAGSGNAEK